MHAKLQNKVKLECFTSYFDLKEKKTDFCCCCLLQNKSNNKVKLKFAFLFCLLRDSIIMSLLYISSPSLQYIYLPETKLFSFLLKCSNFF